MSGDKPILRGCDVLPPMDSLAERQQLRGRAAPKGPRHGDRFALLNAFVDFTLASLRRNEIAVWLVLYRDTKDGIARTGQADIARRIGTSTRTVRRMISRLARRGLLKVIRRGGLQRGPSAYRVRPLGTENG